MKRKTLDWLVLLAVTVVAGFALAGAGRLAGGGAANVITVTAEGYVNPFDVTVTVDGNGAIQSIDVGGAQFNETAGKGALAKEEAFLSQFVGKSGTLVLGTDIDAISGATITSKAVVDAVNRALQKLSGGSTATASAEGYGGPIEVKVTVDESGAISAIEINTETFKETQGAGSKVLDESFTNQFIGKSGKLTLGTDIDAASGATISSTAVVKAVNEALAKLSGQPIAEETAAPVDTAPAATQAPASDAKSGATGENKSTGPQPTAGVTAKDAKTAVATVKGYGGMFDVTVTVDGAGAIQSVSVGGDTFNESKGLGARAQEPEFAAQFVGKTYPVKLGEGVDAISRATITSTAVVNGVNQALEKLQNP